MAINLDERYPGRANPKTLSYPQGSFKNRTSPTSKDGTYLEQDWANDFLGFFQRMMVDAGITGNDQVDTAESSQYFDALVRAVGSRFPKYVSFAEAVAVTEDIGPIIVIGMDGIWEWTETAHFTGYRHPYCGLWMDGWTPTPLPFQIEATGGTWSESNEKERRVIARYRESGLVVPAAEWIKGQNMIADIGGGNWKAPDLQDMFKRMAGTDVDTANARGLGKYQEDALQKHRHFSAAVLVRASASGGSAQL